MASYYGSSPGNQRDIDTTNNVYLRDSGQQALCPPESSNMVKYFDFQQPKYSGGPFSQMLASINNDSESIMNEHVATAYGNDGDNIDAWRSGSMHNHSNSSSSSIAAGSEGGGLSLRLTTQLPISSSSSSSSFHSSTCPIFPPPPHQSQSSDHEKQNLDPCVGLINISMSINSSKYLKAAQNLLDEIVNVHMIAFKQKVAGYKGHHEPMMMTSLNNNNTKDNDIDGVLQSNHPDHDQDSSQNTISPSEKQELQNKISQLLAMLDEVDRRYRQYRHQMQMIVSSFDTIAGCGAARPYTALASQTISRHFRSLRDAISSQIQSAQKILVEEESSSTKGCAGISRLRYIDQRLRQQRAALQQLGIMQPHSWRPQRGLPESSVSLLRAWLFEHFLHPYPNDSEKLMLARQTGLTRGQVSNWFINARVRLWKPMIEEMYREEFGGGEILESNSSSENANRMKLDDQNRGSCELLEGEDRSCDQGRNDQYDDEYNGTGIGRPTMNQLQYHHGLDNLTTLLVPKDYDNNNNIEEIMVGAVIQDDRRRFMAPYPNVLGLTLGLQQGGNQGMMPSPAAQLYCNNIDNNTVQGASSSSGGFGPPPHLLYDHFVASSN